MVHPKKKTIHQFLQIQNPKTNTMKKIILLTLAIGLMAGMANAQKAYLRLGLGGGVGLVQYDQNWYNETETTSADNIEMRSASVGGGFNANLAFGYMISQYVGLELGVNQFMGLPKKTTYTYTGNTVNDESTVKLAGTMLQIVPALVITPGLEKVNPYARVGMVIGVLPSLTSSYTENMTSNGGVKATSTFEGKSKDYGGMAMGFTAAAGAAFKLGDKFSFFGELVFNGVTYSPAKGKIKSYSVDGVDKLSDLPTKMKEWTYERKINLDEEIPDGSPDKRQKVTANFSNVELNVGIKFNL